MGKISVVITAWNEEKNLGRCLTSVKWADEVIVIDCSSTDKTPQIAREHGVTVIRRPNNPMLNVNKNFGFEKAKGPWILSLDSDEEIPAELAKEMSGASKGDIPGYWIPRKNIIFGKWIRHGLWWPDKQLRFFQKGKGKFPAKHVHEYIEVDGRTGTLDEPFVHYNYETIAQFLRKLGLYTDNETKNLIETNYQLAWYDALRFPVSDFIKIYFAQGGYKDGLHGLVLALFQGFYSFVVFAKLWEHNKFEEREISLPSVLGEIKQNAKDIRYWMLTARIQSSQNFLQKFFLKLNRRYGR